MKNLLLYAYLFLLPNVVSAQFIVPVEGIQNKDWFLVNYPDRDTAIGSVRDYRCGMQTYDSHQGTDFVIRDFRQMDSGVTIHAAMAGRIYWTQDSLFDRSEQGDTGGYGNFISINHGDSLFTIYAHLRKYSLLVKIGDSVTQGQPLALLGSSGKTTDPHCHFEVWHNGVTIDPWGDSCSGQPVTKGMFTVRPFYDDSMQIISSGVTSGILGLDSIRQHPPDVSSSPINDTAITFWIHGLSHQPGTTQIEWLAPDGRSWFISSNSWTTYFRYWYDWAWINVPPASQAGIWTIHYTVDGVLISTTHFTLPASAVHETPQQPEQLILSPNPAHEFVHLCNLNGKDVRLYDPTGRPMGHVAMSQDGLLDCSRIANAVYTVVASSGATTKLVVIH